MRRFLATLALSASLLAAPAGAETAPRATGGLGLVIERATGSVLLVDRIAHEVISRIEGLGDLSHASVTFSPDERLAYVFGRDGGLTQVDMLTGAITARVLQGGNAIGGAISDDGALVAVSNYEPGGVRVFDAETLEMVADIPSGGKTVGLVDLPNRRFAWTVWETGTVWLADLSGEVPVITDLGQAGLNPYDAVLSGDGRHYIVGLFGEKGLTLFDMWQDAPEPVRFLSDYGREDAEMPVYKMPHLQGWALTEGQFALPAVGQHALLWVERATLAQAGRTALHGQPIFAVAQPGSPYVWVNFALPHNDTLQVLDSRTHEVVATLTPGAAVLHMEFSPRGHELWVSSRDGNRVFVYDTHSRTVKAELEAQSPSGIFFTARAHRTGL
ncbi:cytochrome D1 domain-containing protein [Roseovarius autotrophicus]|uniref:cytochrome D1 domain-containing protein n=1 Tax=Roseovarius autotrophicus TaxID=2824121 RepID=UPI0019ECA3D2|nr:cytochrome D1 domain-containing protein [Roseovarius autotrophicus]MBE0452726.1 protein nirF [Roseovarius sp.]